MSRNLRVGVYECKCGKEFKQNYPGHTVCDLDCPVRVKEREEMLKVIQPQQVHITKRR